MSLGDNDCIKHDGAIYHAAMCNYQRGLAWVERGCSAVLCNLIGHMLGAQNDAESIIKLIEQVDEPLTLSTTSVASIIGFIEGDHWSWYLGGVLLINRFAGLYTKDWM